MKRIANLLLVGGVLLTLLHHLEGASAEALFGPGDTVLAVDIDSGPDSAYPGGENPGLLVDQDPGTKYLNFGGQHTGLIITPALGATTIQSLQLTTANDAEGRDPTSFEIYGSNDPVTSSDNSFGDAESWSLIGAGGLSLPGDRGALGTVRDFANSTSYTSYKLVFPTLKGSPIEGLMQVADLQLFTELAGGGTQVLAAGDAAIAIDDFGGQSRYPGVDAPANAVDGTSSAKYLNFGKENSGVIVSRADGKATIVTSLTFTTGNDIPERDPLTWQLFGANGPVTSKDNSVGAAEDWMLIDAGNTGFDVDPGREAVGAAQAVANSTAYDAYRLVFPSQRQTDGIGEIQIGEILFEGSVIPEPAALTLALAGLAGAMGRRKPSYRGRRCQ